MYHYVKCEVHCKPQPVTSGVVLLGVLLSFRSVHKSGRPTAAASSTGDSMRKYFIHALGANCVTLQKLPRQAENMYAARRCDGCENMQTVTSTRLTNSPSHKRRVEFPIPANMKP